MACIEIYGSSNFRHVLALSILSQKPVKILDIRSNNIEIGITEYETNLLQLIDKIMNGSTIEISSDGTSLFFKPGTLIGGTNHHKCSVHRSIGYYLEFVTWILVLLKNKLTLTLEGITNGPGDPSVDALKISTLNLMKKFGFSLETNINILKRGYAPLGGGACVLTVGPIFSLNPLNITDIGQFKNFRGISYRFY
ncbi:hypothetical protein HZS_4708 [Henneguya salminicola]|nr:hypothetical protein HZS_4708 [Henneguya salminicola]